MGRRMRARFVLLPLIMAGALRAASAPAVELDPFKVKGSPAAFWGFAYSHPTQRFEWLSPRLPYAVWGVLKGSPADRAGITVGDEITSIDGTSYRGLSVREAAGIFFRRTAGDTLKLGLTDPRSRATREVTMVLDGAYTAQRWDGAKDYELVFWRILVRHPADLKLQPTIVRPHPKMPRDRRCVLSWAGTHLTLVERPGAGVEILKGDFSRPRKEAPPAGRLATPGTVLELRADGSFALHEAPRSPRP